MVSKTLKILLGSALTVGSLSGSANVAKADSRGEAELVAFFYQTFLDPLQRSIRDKEKSERNANDEQLADTVGDLGALISFAFGVGITSTQDMSRGALATENPPGTLVNPALHFDTRLSGETYNISGAFSLPGTDITPFFASPTVIGFGFEGSSLDGRATIHNQNLPNGLGITGVGVTPGVFINTPTDVHRATWNVEQDRYAGHATLSGFAARGDNWYFGAGGGISGGFINQEETTSIYADSPAFGANSMSQTMYHSDIDDRFVGGFASVSGGQFFPAPNSGGAFFISGSLSAGLDYHSADLTDRVAATGIGGGLNFNQHITVSSNEVMPTASASFSTGYVKGNWSVSLSAGIDYGKHVEFDIRRPDSSGPGAPLPTTFDLDPATSFTGVLRTTFSF